MMALPINKILCGDSLTELKKLPAESIDCVMTSPPYWALRDYGIEGQLGLEPTFEEYIKNLCDIFDEVKRVLKKSGTCWINLGDTYSGNKEGKTDNIVSNYLKDTTKNIHKKVNGVSEKSLCNIPARFSIEMQNRGWILRNVIIWHKPNCIPSSVKDRFTVDFEYLFFFVKNKKYFFETQYEPVKEESLIRAEYKLNQTDYAWKAVNVQNLEKMGSRIVNPLGRNKRTVWSICTQPFTEAHFAVYPEELCKTPIKAGCPESGIVLDIFSGAGTTALVALKNNRRFIGIELSPKYIEIAMNRLKPYLEQQKLE